MKRLSIFNFKPVLSASQKYNYTPVLQFIIKLKIKTISISTDAR